MAQVEDCLRNRRGLFIPTFWPLLPSTTRRKRRREGEAGGGGEGVYLESYTRGAIPKRWDQHAVAQEEEEMMMMMRRMRRFIDKTEIERQAEIPVGVHRSRLICGIDETYPL
jgi:hypothetical protein